MVGLYAKPISAAVCHCVGFNSTEGRTRNLTISNTIVLKVRSFRQLHKYHIIRSCVLLRYRGVDTSYGCHLIETIINTAKPVYFEP